MSNTRRLRAAVFLSHYHGSAVFAALRSMSAWLDIVLIATDDPLNPASHASRRLWRYGWDENLRQLVPSAARQAGLDAYTGSIRVAEFLNQFVAANPDIIISAVFGQKVPNEMLAGVKQRAYNLHPTIPEVGLDASRGAQALEKIIRRGETRFDITIHRMTDRFDFGEELGRSPMFAIPDELHGRSDGAAILRLYCESASLSATAINAHLPRIVVRDWFGGSKHLLSRDGSADYQSLILDETLVKPLLLEPSISRV